MIDIGRIELAPRDAALFFDIDGTLLDLAARPDEVVVPASLRSDLGAAHQLLDGAVALISGRAVAEIDRLFSPLGLPASGVHGSEFRPTPPGSADATRTAHSRRHPGPGRGDHRALSRRACSRTRASRSPYTGGMAPQFGAAIEAEARAMMEKAPANLTMLRGHAVLEIKGSALDKGMAVDRFLAEDAFRGRRPVFVGDDVTDEAAFAAVTRHGGYAFAVGRPMEGTMDWFASPSEVRRWLGHLVGRTSAQAVA